MNSLLANFDFIFNWAFALFVSGSGCWWGLSYLASSPFSEEGKEALHWQLILVRFGSFHLGFIPAVVSW